MKLNKILNDVALLLVLLCFSFATIQAQLPDKWTFGIGVSEPGETLVWVQYRFTPFYTSIQPSLSLKFQYDGRNKINHISQAQFVYESVRIWGVKRELLFVSSLNH